MTTIRKMVYGGAGMDFLPVLFFPNVHQFIFIDCLPRYNEDSSEMEEFEKLDKAAVNSGLQKISYNAESNLHIYFHPANEQYVYYYSNTELPHDFKGDVRDAVQGWDAIYIAGHFPHECLLDAAVKDVPLTFIGIYSTLYKLEREEEVMFPSVVSNYQRFKHFWYITPFQELMYARNWEIFGSICELYEHVQFN